MATALLRVDGVPETSGILRELGPRAATNIARRVAVRIAKDARDRIRSRAPKKTGTLRRAIRHRRTRSKPGFADAVVYITHGSGQKNDAYYWHFLEFGTASSPARIINQGKSDQRSVPARRAVPAKPFILPVVVEMRGELPGIYLREFGRQLEKELVKAVRV